MNTFESYTLSHFLPVIFFAALTWVSVAVARHKLIYTQQKVGLCLSLLVLGSMVGGSFIKLLNGSYQIMEDLPLYLCRIVAWMLPFVLWNRNRRLIGIFYFWILAGTLQGIVTPDLEEGFPSYFYFRYWCLHAGLVAAILYTVIVFRIRITWKDFWNAVLLTQAYLVLVHAINVALGSNYSYTVEKPPGASILDLFGDWPWYILGGELLMFVLFTILMLPWVCLSRRKA